MIPKSVGCDLVGRDLGRQFVKVDLIFYGGCHFAHDKLPQSPHLTLTHEVASLLNIRNGAEIPAALFHGGSNNNGSSITLKGTEGEEMWDFTAHAAREFSKALHDMK
ncbi:hypothetical protein MMC31_001669 [Peltigera leucophlebia]|nr:hypothetical protein [Peltigera leucophlebia]